MEVRKQADAQLAELIRNAPLESAACNLCQGSDFAVLAQIDGHGLPVKTVLCRRCGLVAINPRPAKDWYAEYYRYMDGRRRVYKHGEANPKEAQGAGFDAARRHGRALAARLSAFIEPGLTIDVGSAEGGLLAGMQEIAPIEPIGIEPTVARAEYATSRGIKTYAGLIEDVATIAPDLPAAANIVCTKSLNHLLDPQFFFRWAYDTLRPGGKLILEVKNFRQQARMSGRAHFAIQLDHPFMFTPENLGAFVRSAGFDVLHSEVDEEKSIAERRLQRQTGLPIGHMRVAAIKADRAPFAVLVLPPEGSVRALARDLSRFPLYLHYLTRYARIVTNMKQRIGFAV
ncbi:methyltransferase domain-containing protein [Candidatus Parcubacteria bacterium]|nr:MAG: methyltransferase domain-containing protein [Candidatus Parcubacteria bacterium]